jgi:hypothetical protein
VGNEEMQAAIKELQDTMVVMAHIEKMRSEHIREQVELPIDPGNYASGSRRIWRRSARSSIV